jgi:outer membrane immunogenic protein
MSKALSFLLLALSLLSGSALADANDWTGVYAGAQFGQGSSSFDYSYHGAAAVSFDSDGLIGGLTVGYNWQKENFVLGVEGDYSLSEVGSSTLVTPAPCYIQGCNGRIKSTASGRLRIGYAVQSFLPFLTVGAAFADIKGSADLGACGSAYCGFSSSRWGQTYGAGVEWRINQKWSAKAEYLYSHFDAPAFSSSNVTVSSINLNVARLGVNYHF